MTQLVETLVGLPAAWAILLKATALLAAGWIGHRLLLRANPRWRVLLWRGVLLGLAALPALAVLCELRVEVAKPPAPQPVATHSPAPMFAAMAVPAAFEPQSAGWTPVPAMTAAAPTPIAPPEPAFLPGDFVMKHWAGVLLGVWALGAALLGLRLACVYLRMQKIFAAAGPAAPARRALLERVARGLGHGGAIALKSTRALASPLLAGIVRPTIYVPARMLDAATDEELAAILAHEVAHVRSRDLHWLLAARWCSIALWPHPLAWRLQSAHTAACEEVSDAVAAGYLKDAAAYVRTLARVALAVAGRPAAAGGIPMARSSQIAWRLQILKTKFYASPLARRRVFAAIVVGALALTAFGGVKIVYAQSNAKNNAISGSDQNPGLPLPPGARVVHFPKEKSLGHVSISPAVVPDGVFPTMMNTGGYLPDIWKRLGRAQGDVVIPEGRQVGLSLDPSTADMKQLLKFGANDIDQLMVTGPGNSALTFEMDVLPYIRHMRGLKGLVLMDVGIGGEGVKSLSVFPSLRALWIGSVVQAHPVSLRNADLPALGDLKQLEILSVSSERITDAGLAQLARVKTLRWLEINTTNIKGPGLAELSKLSNLEFFSPCGFGFNNQKLQYLGGNTTIKRLPLGGTAKFMQIDDDSLAILARMKGIEDLNFHWNESITDAGVAHLAAMPHLKTLDINHSRVTAKGIASLKNVKTIEELRLPSTLGDDALVELESFANLKRLDVGAQSHALVTDAGLKHMAGLVRLEWLAISGDGITDAGMETIAGLKSLKRIDLGWLPQLTNAGLDRLAANHNLEHFSLDSGGPNATIAGLNRFNACTRLKYLSVQGIKRDTTLNLPALTNLETLAIGISDGLRDGDLACIANMKKLNRLWLMNCDKQNGTEITEGIGNEGVVHLAGLRELDYLIVNGGPNLTDEGLDFLAGMKRLSWLNLTGNFGDGALRRIGATRALENLSVLTISGNFTDAGLKALEPMKKISQLHVDSRNHFSPAAIARLKANKPDIAQFAVKGDCALPRYKAAPAVHRIEPLHAMAAPPAPTTIPGARVVHFPPDRSLGTLMVQDAGVKREIESFYYWINGADWDSWRVLGKARGDVVVPAGKHLALMIAPEAARDLTPLERLGPNDLDTLNYNYNLTDAGLACIAGLTGLTELNLVNYGQDRGADAPVYYTSAGLKDLEGLQNLRYFMAPTQLDDSGLAHVARLKSLKGLYIKTNRLTDAGLAQLANMPGLEELELGGGEITDAGLAHLARLPRLSYLLLWGDHFGDASLAYLPTIPNLKILHIGRLPVTDTGMESIGKISGLERLDLYGTKITDAGLVPLTQLKSLRKLDLNNTQVTGRGMQILKGCKTIEHLSLPDNILDDESLAAISELTNLKYLRISNSYMADRSREKTYYTDAGVARLCANAPGLEDLRLAGQGVTDASMSHIARLKHLKSLFIFGSPGLTDAGLARLKDLKSLETFHVDSSTVTTAGVNHLNALPNLRSVNIGAPGQTTFLQETLDISGLTRLEQFSAPFLRDRDLACFKNLKQLRWLQTGHFEWQFNDITDAGVANLAGLENMDRLSLDGRTLTDRTLSRLAGMKKIDSLSLRGSFTDAGLARLEGLKTIRFLGIQSDKNLSQDAIDRLRATLPMATMFSVQGDRNYPTQPPKRTRKATDAPKVHPQAGEPAPDFTVTTLAGTNFSLSDQRGRVVVVYFWATWCAPCVKNTPANKNLYDKLKAKFGNRFVWIDLSLDDFDAPVGKHVKQFGLNQIEARIGKGSRIAADYGVSGVPDAFLIGPDGKVLLNRESPQVDTETAIAKALKMQ